MDDLQKLILSGQLDNSLDYITEVIRRRKEILSVSTFYELKIGDTVIFNSHVRPQYMQGVRARIIDKKQKKVVVELIDQAAIGRFGKRITTPVNIIDKVEDAKL